MASAMRVLRKFQSSDGRVKAVTASGVLVLAAAVALAVGVLPAIADHGTSKVPPVLVEYGGGSGACAFVDSVAEFEAHDNNPMTHIIEGPDGTKISITVDGNLFDFEVLTAGMAVYDVVVNGGPHNNHYDYDGILGHPVTEDFDLHAPRKSKSQLHNLSHINICYDVDTAVDFQCDEEAQAILLNEGTFTEATATIFANSVVEICEPKTGSFFIDNTDSDTEDPHVTLNFGNGPDIVAGRLNVTKDFGDPSLFVDLQYERSDTSPRVDVIWCNVRSVDTGTDEEAQFGDEVLPPGQYPSLLDDNDNPLKDSDGKDATACKVYEGENAAGIQYNVLYFEFLDPNFY